MLRLSAETEYAYVALLKLAEDQGVKPNTKLMEIVADKGLSEKFMLQVLTDLRHAGLVNSRRGKRGGYNLAKRAKEITLGDLLAATNGHAASRNGKFRIAGQQSVLASTWHKMLGEMDMIASKMTLAQALAGEGKAAE